MVTWSPISALANWGRGRRGSVPDSGKSGTETGERPHPRANRGPWPRSSTRVHLFSEAAPCDSRMVRTSHPEAPAATPKSPATGSQRTPLLPWWPRIARSWYPCRAVSLGLNRPAGLDADGAWGPVTST